MPPVGDGRRPRRFEPFPRWGYVLFALTLAVTPIAVLLAFSDHRAVNGTSCGGALFPTGVEDRAGSAVCDSVIAEAQPRVVLIGALAVVLVLASITTLVVRAWIPRDPSTPD